MPEYHLRNKPEREITDKAEINEILKAGKFCTIAMCHENEPYIVTLSYGYDQANQALFFHSSAQGLKLDFIRQNPDVCATVIEDGGYVPNECEHNFRSVVFWGKMRMATELPEKKHGMGILLNHLEKDSHVVAEKLMKSDGYYPSKMAVLRLDILQIHGKAGK